MTQCHTIARLCWTTIAPVLVLPQEQLEAPPVAMILSMDQHIMEKLMGKIFKLIVSILLKINQSKSGWRKSKNSKLAQNDNKM